MTENLNLMTRKELDSTLGLLPATSDAAGAIADLMAAPAEAKGIRAELDTFEVLFAPDIIEDISYTVEQYSYAIAERYVAKLENEAQTDDDDREHFFWQALHEKWAYLEVMGG